jgi:GNAT superfamily N-acetyltransferase
MPECAPFLTRAAEAGELPLIRAWLPETLRGTPPASFIVALDAATGAIAGIAALRLFGDAVGRFRIYVAHAHRRRGCGTILLESVQQAALQGKATVLLTGTYHDARPADEADAAVLAFFRARGLSVAQEVVRYRADVPTALAVVESLYNRSMRRPAHTRAARIVTADQADLDALADFAVRHVGGFREAVAARLRGAGRAYSPALSMAAIVGNRIVGAQLVEARGLNAFFETLAVDVSHRGGWVNLALQYHSGLACKRSGIKRFEFDGDAKDRAAARLAQHFAAVQVGRRKCWGCALLR